MLDKIHLEGGPEISPPLAESEEKILAILNTCLGFPKPRLVPATQGSAALLRKPAGSCYGIGAGSCSSPLLRTIGSCYFQSSEGIVGFKL